MFNTETRVVVVQLIFVFVGFQNQWNMNFSHWFFWIQNYFGKLLNELTTLWDKSSPTLCKTRARTHQNVLTCLQASCHVNIAVFCHTKPLPLRPASLVLRESGGGADPIHCCHLSRMFSFCNWENGCTSSSVGAGGSLLVTAVEMAFLNVPLVLAHSLML